MSRVINIFISYARRDSEQVEELYGKLTKSGYKPWLDQKDILPGESWKQAIQRAIQSTDLFLACFSTNAIDRRGMIQREVKQALDYMKEKLSTDIFVIPARLEKCNMPEELKHLQWVDLFEKDGFVKLEAAIQKQLGNLEKDTTETTSKHSHKSTIRIGHQPKIVWPPRQLTPESLLMSAKSNLLLVGTSLTRAMNAEIVFYRQWLDANLDRRLGLLFLNPNGPHSSGRSRPNVRRSSPAIITSSLDLAYKENRQRRRFLPAIYEGPYRYTARASDIGYLTDKDESKINIVTSSRTSGTTMGFEVFLSSKTTQSAYKFYELELLDLWKTALANPPGHGVRLIYRSDVDLDSDAIRATAEEFIKQFGRHSYSFLAYSADQYHIPFSSICKTQLQPFLSPLYVGNTPSEECLPRHFGDFLYDLIGLAAEFSKRDTPVVLDQITVDENGEVRLESGKTSETDLVRLISNFREKQAELVSKYASQYLDESWSSRKSGLGNRFSSIDNMILPHVAIGVAFDDSNGLPVHLDGGNYSTKLPKRFEFVCGDFSVVHYAYPSLLRCIGEFIVSSTKDLSASGDTILRKLGIDLDF